MKPCMEDEQGILDLPECLEYSSARLLILCFWIFLVLFHFFLFIYNFLLLRHLSTAYIFFNFLLLGDFLLSSRPCLGALETRTDRL